MPVYDYACESCGPFSAQAGMAAFDQPAPCGQCGRPSPRMVAAPNLGRTERSARIAHERNERSAHEPRVVTHEQLHGKTGAHRHGHAHRAPPPGASRLGSNLQQSPHRSLIGH